jgi:hypothetical protein
VHQSRYLPVVFYFLNIYQPRSAVKSVIYDDLADRTVHPAMDPADSNSRRKRRRLMHTPLWQIQKKSNELFHNSSRVRRLENAPIR